MDARNYQNEDDMKSITSLVRCTLISLAVIVVLAPYSWGKNLEVASQRALSSIKVDGQISDWPENAIHFLSDQEATIGVCNDSEKVYVMVCSRKAEWARLIRMSGLTIYLDAKGEKQKNFMIRFVGGPTREQIMAVSGESRPDSMKQMPPEMRDRMRERDKNFENKFTCFLKDVIVEKPIPMDGAEGPAAAFGVDKGFFIYEFSVPLKESTVRNYGLGVPADRKIGLGLVWGDVDKSKMGEGMPGGGGFHGGFGGGGTPPDGGGGFGGGPGAGGGDRGGRGGPGGRGGFEQPKKQEVWLKVQLTTAGQ